MAQLKLILDKRRVKQDKTYPLIFRIFQNGDSRIIPTGFSLKEEEWNSKTNLVSKNHPNCNAINARVKEFHTIYFSKIIEFEKENPASSNIQHLKEFITAKEEETIEVTIFDFWEKEIKFLHKANRNGGASVYNESLRALHRVKNLKVPFAKVDYSFLKELEGGLISNGNKINTVGIHFRTFRAIYNKAINAKLISYEHYPFRSYRIRRESVTPKVLTIEELRAYFNLKLSKEDTYRYESWLLGKLMFMLIGINFKDMILIKESQLSNGRLFYNRSKTGRPYSIKLVHHATEILDYFKGRDSFSIIGRVKESDLVEREKIPVLMQSKNGAFNAHLRQIGKMLGYKENLRGYFFRYTWANLAKQLGYSKDLIAEALGHEYGNKVTGIYLEAYDLELIDKMNERVCNDVMN
ncbi:MAG: site-specific integrase [Bacteroidota bacterium]|nr:site-specific integrase [Bacteroidota bacterium]